MASAVFYVFVKFFKVSVCFYCDVSACDAARWVNK